MYLSEKSRLDMPKPTAVRALDWALVGYKRGGQRSWVAEAITLPAGDRILIEIGG